MDWTFGIITNGGDLKYVIYSIRQLKIPNYEIIVVGNHPQTYDAGPDVICIPFDETIKPAWITRKKNIIHEQAKYENIAMLHDYIFIHPDFYTGFLKFGNDWEFCVTQIKNADGTRYRDYLLFPYYPWWKKLGMECKKFLLPYWMPNDYRLNRFMYVSGSFYIIKKQTALRFPLNEDIVWGGEGEDVELCVRLANENILIKVNPHSTVQFMKFKVKAFCMDHEHLNIHDLKALNEALKGLEERDPEFFKQKLDWMKRDTIPF
jgi:hypothetical protein